MTEEYLVLLIEKVYIKNIVDTSKKNIILRCRGWHYVVEGFHFSQKISNNDAQRLWTRKIQAQTAELGQDRIILCGHLLVLRSIATLAREIDI